MVTLKELNPHGHVLTPQQTANQECLFHAIAELRAAYGKPMLVTSGVRSKEQHEAIYRKMGRQAPKGSSHLTGAAVDFSDRDGALARFCLDNLALLKKAGLYMEDPSCTETWCHLQVTAPASGNTVFVPFIKKARS